MDEVARMARPLQKKLPTGRTPCYYCGLFRFTRNDVAEVAQSVEQLIRNEKVGGSIPLFGTIQIKRQAQPTGWALLFLGAM